MAVLLKDYEMFIKKKELAKDPEIYWEKIVHNRPGFFESSVDLIFNCNANKVVRSLAEIVVTALISVYWNSVYLSDREKERLVEKLKNMNLNVLPENETKSYSLLISKIIQFENWSIFKGRIDEYIQKLISSNDDLNLLLSFFKYFLKDNKVIFKDTIWLLDTMYKLIIQPQVDLKDNSQGKM